jgi:hypothetical protein
LTIASPELLPAGEVGQAHPARRVLLAEDHIPAGAVESPPFANAALHCPAHPRDDLGMPTANLFSRERVGAAAPAGLLFLGR